MDRLVDVFWIARYDYEPDWLLMPHRHDFYQLICVLDGAGTAYHGDTVHELREDLILFAPPGVRHGLAANRNCRIKTLDTKFMVYGKQLRRDLQAVDAPVMDTGHRIRPVLEQVRIEGMRARPWYRQLCNALMLEALVVLLRESAHHVPVEEDVAREPNLDDEQVRRAVSYLRENYADNITLADIGAAVGYSSDYLARKFRSRMGVSVHHYLLCYRIERARQMLEYTEDSIKEIASSTGFKSIHHFTRAFKDIAGIPPATWRRTRRDAVWQDVCIDPQFVNKDITLTSTGENPGGDPGHHQAAHR